MSSLFSIFKRLPVAILCLCAINSVVACEDYAQNLKSVYGYTVIRHKVKESNIAAIEQALEKHEWQRSQNLTKDEAKAEWESFMSDIIAVRRNFYHKVSCLFESSSGTLTGSSGLL